VATKQRIAVTGGAGYIGSHTVTLLLEAGHEVLILDSFANAAEDVPDRVAGIAGRGAEVVRGDITDPASYRDAFTDFIEHWGYLQRWEDYAEVLLDSDVLVSTARHEFFGVAAVEAMTAGCFPVLPERLAYPASFVYSPLLKILYPIVWAVNWVTNGLLRLLGVRLDDDQGNALTREELRTVVAEAGAMIPERSQTMLLAILDLENATVEDIMIPRNEVDGIDIGDPEEEIINAIRNATYTRLPVFDGSIDSVIGIIHARDALHALLDRGLGKEHLREISREPYFVPEGTHLYQQLLNFQREKRPVGLVVDEYGDFLGLITLTDLLEEIVGEFTTDPADEISEVHRGEDGNLLIDCGISVRDLNRALRWKLPTKGPKTLNGLILEYMETIPEPGTSLKLHGRPLEIIQTTESAVKTVKYSPQRPGTDGSAATRSGV
jgi:Mg2+/Co2+ transporter CorB